MDTNPTPATDDKLASLKTLTTVIYALYALSLFIGITAIVAIVLNYIKREDVQGTWLESHFAWQMRTFWWGLAVVRARRHHLDHPDRLGNPGRCLRLVHLPHRQGLAQSQRQQTDAAVISGSGKQARPTANS